jgi:hypothetical protein
MRAESRWTIGALAVIAGGLCVGQLTSWRQNRRTQVQLEYLTELAANLASNRVDRRTAAIEPASCNMLSADDLRTIVREERCPPPPTTPVATAERAKDLPAIDPQGFERAQEIVDRALATGAWGQAETTEFRTLLPRLSTEQRDELMRELLPSVNAQKVKLNVVGPLF